MIKNIALEDTYTRVINTNKSYFLTTASAGVNRFEGISGSSVIRSSSQWSLINTLFYRPGKEKYSTFHTHFHQSKSIANTVKVISVSNKNYGTMIDPGSFKMESIGVVLQDDASGNLYDTAAASGSSHIKGNIFYGQGTAIITSEDAQYQSFGSAAVDIFFKATHRIYEINVNCRLGRGEFNGTMNPSAIHGVGNAPANEDYNNIIHSPFVPYITKIGLYNNDNVLVAVAALSQPIMKDSEQDMTIRIRLDL